MSRSPEIPQEPDWYNLALQEALKIPVFHNQEEKTAKTAAKIIRNISLKQHTIPGVQTFQLSFGSKLLTINIRENKAYTYLRINNPLKKTQQETTILYLAAKLFMQSVANQKGEAIKYHFSTRDPKLKQWVKSRGTELFQFTEHPREDNHYLTVIKPQDS